MGLHILLGFAHSFVYSEPILLHPFSVYLFTLLFIYLFFFSLLHISLLSTNLFRLRNYRRKKRKSKKGRKFISRNNFGIMFNALVLKLIFFINLYIVTMLVLNHMKLMRNGN